MKVKISLEIKRLFDPHPIISPMEFSTLGGTEVRHDYTVAFSMVTKGNTASFNQFGKQERGEDTEETFYQYC